MLHNRQITISKKIPCSGIKKLLAAWGFVIAAMGLYSPHVWAAPFIYATGPGDNVTVVDGATNAFIKIVPVCTRPAAVAVTPDGTEAYVSCLDSPSVLVINTMTNTVTHTVNLPLGSRSQGIAITPDGAKAYVVIQDSNAVGVINTAAKTFDGSIGGSFNLPSGIAYVIEYGSLNSRPRNGCLRYTITVYL